MEEIRKAKITEQKKGRTILAEGIEMPFNDIYGGLNDNILAVGGSGTGKTRGVVRPNILECTGSYVISDPKGNLYDLYAPYLESNGYRVERLDLVNPMKSTVCYNCFHYLHDETDVLKLASALCEIRETAGKDMFWEYSAQLLIQSIIAYFVETSEFREGSIPLINWMLEMGARETKDDVSYHSMLEAFLTDHIKAHPGCMVEHFYKGISGLPDSTWGCVVAEAAAKYSAFNTAEIRSLLGRDTIHLPHIGQQKTAMFVVVSDTDRSMDAIANVFFSQTMTELCKEADSRKDSRLMVPVRFILDDFATNVRIDQFPRMISSIRSRGISAMLMIQSEAQLESGYGRDAKTIISNCDTYLYLGGNDIETARSVGQRCDLPMMEVLNMPVGSCFVFQRGKEARRAVIADLNQNPNEVFARKFFGSGTLKPRRINYGPSKTDIFGNKNYMKIKTEKISKGTFVEEFISAEKKAEQLAKQRQQLATISEEDMKKAIELIAKARPEAARQIILESETATNIVARMRFITKKGPRITESVMAENGNGQNGENSGTNECPFA